MSVQRLIDANALKEQIDYYIKEAGWSEHDNRVLGWCKEFIDNAPTVNIKDQIGLISIGVFQEHCEKTEKPKSMAEDLHDFLMND